jgi:hypothetical protein
MMALMVGENVIRYKRPMGDMTEVALLKSVL